MVLSHQHRSTIQQKLAPILGDEEADALLSHFPAREGDEPVTKDFLRAELAELRAEMSGAIGGLRTEMFGAIGGLRTEMHGQIGSLRTEMHGQIGSLRADMYDQAGQLRAEMHDGMRQMVMWSVGSVFAGMGLAAGIASALAG